MNRQGLVPYKGTKFCTDVMNPALVAGLRSFQLEDVQYVADVPLVLPKLGAQGAFAIYACRHKFGTQILGSAGCNGLFIIQGSEDDRSSGAVWLDTGRISITGSGSGERGAVHIPFMKPFIEGGIFLDGNFSHPTLGERTMWSHGGGGADGSPSYIDKINFNPSTTMPNMCGSFWDENFEVGTIGVQCYLTNLNTALGFYGMDHKIGLISSYEGDTRDWLRLIYGTCTQITVGHINFASGGTPSSYPYLDKLVGNTQLTLQSVFGIGDMTRVFEDANSQKNTEITGAFCGNPLSQEIANVQDGVAFAHGLGREPRSVFCNLLSLPPSIHRRMASQGRAHGSVGRPCRH